MPSIAAVCYRELILSSVTEVNTEVCCITDLGDFLILIILGVLEVVLLELAIEFIDIWRRVSREREVCSDL